MSLRRRLAIGAGTGAAAYVLQRAAGSRWRAGPEDFASSGLTLPPDARHHEVPMSDGGIIHAVERGEGPATVLLHGFTLSLETWVRQFHQLPGRVVAMSQRGHGRSVAGEQGYGFDRLGTDLLEVLAALDVNDAVLVGHSMGGMVAQLLAVERPAELANRVRSLVFLDTSPGPIVPGRLAGPATSGARRVLEAAVRRGRRPLPRSLSVWAVRDAFGASPRPIDVAFTMAMVDAVAPEALAGLVPHLLRFDVRDRLHRLSLPTAVVVGSRDRLIPARSSRAIVARVPWAELTVLPGCGHMAMLERPDEVCDLVTAARPTP